MMICFFRKKLNENDALDFADAATPNLIHIYRTESVEQDATSMSIFIYVVVSIINF